MCLDAASAGQPEAPGLSGLAERLRTLSASVLFLLKAFDKRLRVLIAQSKSRTPDSLGPRMCWIRMPQARAQGLSGSGGHQHSPQRSEPGG
jgi:hypothetical protein